MERKNHKEFKKFTTTKIIRVVNILAVILFMAFKVIDKSGVFALYYAFYYYLWLYILFLCLEIRYYKLTQSSLVNYTIKQPLSIIGIVLPVLFVFCF